MAWRPRPWWRRGECVEGVDDRLYRERHIGARIAVGDRVDVESVDDLAVGSQELPVGGHCRPQVARRQRCGRGHR